MSGFFLMVSDRRRRSPISCRGHWISSIAAVNGKELMSNYKAKSVILF